MGLLDQFKSSAGGGDDTASLVDAMSSLFEQNGGLQGLLGKFNEGGLGDAFASWVGKGDNEAVSGDQVQGALGQEQLAGLAAKLGIDGNAVASLLAEKLPAVIDQLTPDGKAEGGADTGLAALLPSLLEKLGGGRTGAS